MKHSTMFRLLSLTLALLLCGCAGAGEDGPQRYQAQFLDLFDTPTTIIGYADSQEEFSAKAQQLHDRLEEYHQLYDIYNEYPGVNNLKTINDQAGGQPVPVDTRILDLLEHAQSLYQLTDGRVNVALGSVLSLWHRYREEALAQPNLAQLPPMQELRAAAAHTDLSLVEVDESRQTVYLPDSDMSLDVGAIAKGYAVEQVARWAQEQGWDNLLISAGGNVRAIGARLDGTPWQVGVQDPNSDSGQQLWCTLGLEGQALVTSGVYQRYYTVDSQRYHHIIDPETLMPSTRYLSVSIAAEDSGLSDGLSTALFNMDLQQGQQLIDSLEGVEALWIMADGSQAQSDGFAALIQQE